MGSEFGVIGSVQKPQQKRRMRGQVLDVPQSFSFGERWGCGWDCKSLSGMTGDGATTPPSNFPDRL